MKLTIPTKTCLAMALAGVLITGCSSTPEKEPVEEPIAATEPVQMSVPEEEPAPVVVAEPEPVLAVHKKTIHFEFDSAEITSDSRQKLVQLISTAQNNDLVNTRIVIQGHTDATGPKTYNETLSQERAKTVEMFLKANLNSEEWKVEGLGESQPIATNENPDGREMNRRVVIEYMSSNKPLALVQ